MLFDPVRMTDGCSPLGGPRVPYQRAKAIQLEKKTVRPGSPAKPVIIAAEIRSHTASFLGQLRDLPGITMNATPLLTARYIETWSVCCPALWRALTKDHRGGGSQSYRRAPTTK